jgi:hypothetical protein
MANKYTKGVTGGTKKGTDKALDKYRKYMEKHDKGELDKGEYSKNKIAGTIRKKRKAKDYKDKIANQLYGEKLMESKKKLKTIKK